MACEAGVVLVFRPASACKYCCILLCSHRNQLTLTQIRPHWSRLMDTGAETTYTIICGRVDILYMYNCFLVSFPGPIQFILIPSPDLAFGCFHISSSKKLGRLFAMTVWANYMEWRWVVLEWDVNWCISSALRMTMRRRRRLTHSSLSAPFSPPPGPRAQRQLSRESPSPLSPQQWHVSEAVLSAGKRPFLIPAFCVRTHTVIQEDPPSLVDSDLKDAKTAECKQYCPSVYPPRAHKNGWLE